MSMPILTVVDEVDNPNPNQVQSLENLKTTNSDTILVQPKPQVRDILVIRQNTGRSAPVSPLASPIHGIGPKELGPKKVDTDDVANIVECPFKQHGCHKRGERSEVKRHVRDDRNLHLVLLCQSLNPIRNNALRQQKFHMDNYVATILTIERAEAVFEKFGSQYTFKIPKVDEAVVKASKNKKHRTIFSQPFYTHGCGYKMMAIAAPYGDGNALREYFSVFVCLMEGEHDAIQEWPFRYHVSFSLLSSVDKKECVTKTYIPDDHPEAKDYMMRPSGLRNGAFGFQDFFELQNLNKYTNSDDLYIRIRIHLKESRDKEIDSSKCQGDLIDFDGNAEIEYEKPKFD